MESMNKLTILEINFNSSSIFPAIISDEQEMVLIDCGYSGFLPLLKDAAEKEGLEFNKLTKVIITHHDFDHMGALAQIKKEYPNIKILASVEEEKYISGKEKSLRLQQAEALYDQLPESEKENARNFHKMLESVENIKVDLGLQDKQFLDWCGGIEVITTPGHMPGHISIYLKETKTLIAGDALVVENGELMIANPQYTLDMQKAKESIRKLLSYKIEKILCYHGGIYSGKIKDALELIIN
jgi:glyoxylase-like metal-dependent hydrolase (beta-lactamase superfamily II)